MKKIYFLIVMILMLNSTAFSQNQWYLQNQTSGGTLYSVHFIDNKTGWTVGEQGQFLKTTDGGRAWLIRHISSQTLFSVFFTDINTGWVVGGTEVDRTILITTDGGSNWEVKSSGTGASLRSVFFINISTGWVVGYQSSILKSTNGGNNWTNQTIEAGYDLESVYFINSNTGWTVGPRGIFKTTNSGINWTNSAPVPQDFASVYFLNANTGWVTGHTQSFKTTNGGLNWSWVYYNAPGSLFSVQFVDAFTGWEVGYRGSIYKSTDGGWLNWTKQISNTSNNLYSVFFIDNNTGWTVGANGTILSTINVSDSNDVGVTSIIEPVRDFVYSVDCINSNTIIPKAAIRNFGRSNQNNFFNVYCEIEYGNNIVYSNSKQDTISSGETHIINFDPFTLNYDPNALLWTYNIKSWTSLVSDTNNVNDTIKSTFNVNNPNYGYSNISNYYFLNSSINASCIPDQPVFNWEDTTGSVNLIVGGVAMFPFTEGNIFNGCFRLPDVIPGGNKFRFFDTCYDTIVISTNGIIGLGGSLTGMTSPNPVSIPSVSAPRPAIFPFWYACNYADPDIIGRNLKYKVSGNKFIITYDKIPIYNSVIDPNDYVSYQVVLETEAGCGIVNGKITVLFDDSKSGSTFLNNYHNGNLNANTVGIQSSSGTYYGIQYRYSNSSGNLITPGPLFGSPMAIAFGEINSVLPIELASFSSSVNENNVTLNWQTNFETNNFGFDIERSVTNVQWTKTGFVQGNGNSIEPKEYSFTDKNLATGKYNYRLKQIDFNGNYEYFNLTGEVIIGIPDKYELSQNYPNPFNPSTVIRYSLIENGFTSLKVYDIRGREVAKLINEKQDAGRYEVIFNGSNIASGVYFYELRSGSFVSQKRMLLLK